MPQKKSKAEKNGVSRAVTKARPERMQAPAGAATGTVFPLKVTLNKIKPPVWRRVQTKDCTLGKLHDILQVSMGWEDYHLHVFTVGGERYGDPGSGRRSSRTTWIRSTNGR